MHMVINSELIENVKEHLRKYLEIIEEQGNDMETVLRIRLDLRKLKELNTL